MFMFKRHFSLRNVMTIVICLAVSMMIASCKDNGKDDDKGNGGNNGGGGTTGDWPSASVLSKYGLDGMTKPPAYSDGFVLETGTAEVGKLTITFSGNASTATSVKKYFSDNSSWEQVEEANLSGTHYTYYSKKANGIDYATYFAETDEGYSFQLVSTRAPIEE